MSAGDPPMYGYVTGTYSPYFPTWVYPYWQEYFVHPCPVCQPRCPCCGRMLAPNQPGITWTTGSSSAYGTMNTFQGGETTTTAPCWTTDTCNCNQGATSGQGDEGQ